MDKFCLIGYSGHSFVVFDNLNSNGFEVIGYCEQNEKKNNPWNLTYFGNESKAIDQGLFETNLPAPGVATPAIYSVKGKQYVVIACGGSKWKGGVRGDSYVAFSLPDL